MIADISDPPQSCQKSLEGGEKQTEVRAPSCPWVEKSTLKAVELKLVSDMSMQMASGNNRINYPWKFLVQS